MFRPLLPLIRRLHFYAGILVAPFLLVATISGGLYALAPQVESVTYRHLLHVDSDGPPHSIDEQVAAARESRLGVVTAVDAAAAPHETTRVYFADNSLGESERRTVFVDPTTSRVLGQSVTFGSNGALPLRSWLDGLHRNLHLGEPGRTYSELAASWLWVVALGGLALWVNRFRIRRRNTGRSWWRIASVERTGTRRNRTLNWHGAVGVWLVVGLVFLSATGLTWSKHAGQNIADLRHHLNWDRPPLPTAVPAAHHHGAAPGPTVAHEQPSASFDALLAVARAHGLSGRVEIDLPTGPRDAVTITQTRLPWRYSVDAIAVDPTTMGVTADVPFSTWSLPAKLAEWGIQLHMGILFGWVSAVALLLLMIALTTVIVRGYLLWWRRGPGLRAGRPPQGGTMRSAFAAADMRTRSVFALLFVAILVVGWFVPLLGIPLLAFVVVDALVGYCRAG
ncbi:PepSY domain-containing protein [Gordonia sp. X0973]|uniref:PepSY-associated TM helix domain-containing protein n=1 Tax=Gordonia sp. X0973 TaxID=2742602 RepID=UPI000F51F62C|nr:PepSY-associated TM helix domain-containing protein [Gordonia sp. X0973]QKT06624.1 PepSY domain-containing protein [Gordonia sp. X0973]